MQTGRQIRSFGRCATVSGVALLSMSLMSSVSAANRSGLSVPVGETELFPSIELGFARVTNGTRAENNEVDVNEFHVKPGLFWLADSSSVVLNASYDGDYTQTDDDRLDYIDHNLQGNVRTTFSKRSQLNASLGFDWDHVDYGTGIGGSDNLSSVVQFSRLRASIEHEYGAQGARGNLKTGLVAVNLAYQNHDSVTDGLDYSFVRPYARFSLRLTGETRAFTELRFDAVNFDDDSRSRDDVSLLGGLSWLVTGKFGGSFGLGFVQSDSSNPGLDSANELIAEGRILLQPREYSRLDIALSRSIYNSDGQLDETGDPFETISTELNATWEHEWSSRVTSEVDGWVQFLERGCVVPDQIRSSLDANLLLSVRRWVQLGLKLNLEQRSYQNCEGSVASSTGDPYDYTSAGVFVRLTL